MRTGALSLAALACLIPIAARPIAAQQVTDTAAAIQQLRQQLQSGQVTPDQIRMRIQAAGLTPDDVRRRLREAGYPASLLDQYLGTGAPSGGPSLTGDQLERVLRRLSVPPLSDSALAGLDTLGLDTLGIDTTLALPAAGPPIFGRALFQRATTQFQPLEMGPVPPNYRLGPGDDLVLILTGDVQQIYTLPVTREGFVVIPNVGRVPVNGLTMDGLRDALYTYLGRAYSGVQRGPEATTHFEISLSALRRNQVYVVGDAERPGAYEVTSVSTAMQALYQAGGPSDDGSFRNIQIRRGDSVIAVLDVYQYLTRGAATGDVPLDQGDVVFIPVRGRRATIDGDVIRPGIYELKGEEGLRDLLGLAGGIEPEADLRRVQIDRILPPEERRPGVARTLIDVNVAALMDTAGAPIAVQAGDVIHVFAVPEARRNTVTIRGNVWQPGVYEFEPGMTVAELVDRAGGLKDDTYLRRAQIVRTDPQDLSKSVVPVSLGDGADGTALQEYDEVVVYSVAEFRDQRYVTISGAVQNPGAYDFREGMTIRDLIMEAGGLRDDAYVLQAEVARLTDHPDETGDLTKIYDVPMDSSYVISEWARREGAAPGGREGTDGGSNGGGGGSSPAVQGPAPDFELARYDNVFIRRRPGWELQRTVEVTGEVKFPGAYALRRKDERLADVLKRAGGLTPDAYPAGIRFFRRQEVAPDVGVLGGAPPTEASDTTDTARTTLARVNIDLPDVLADSTNPDNLTLLDGDSVYIPQFTPTVRVEGAVLFPVSVMYEPDEGLGYYVGSAGGYARDADAGRARVEYPDGSVKTVSKWLFFKSSPKPEPGARVFVPVKPPGQGTNWGNVIRGGLSVVTGFATLYLLIQRLK